MCSFYCYNTTIFFSHARSKVRTLLRVSELRPPKDFTSSFLSFFFKSSLSPVIKGNEKSPRKCLSSTIALLPAQVHGSSLSYVSPVDLKGVLDALLIFFSFFFRNTFTPQSHLKLRHLCTKLKKGYIRF